MRRFTKKNEPFTCDQCQKQVPQAESTCRNHCPFCLHSKHVDILPGDRANGCQGTLRPVGYEQHPKKGLILLFECERCGAKTRNKALLADSYQPDDYEAILKLTTNLSLKRL